MLGDCKTSCNLREGSFEALLVASNQPSPGSGHRQDAGHESGAGQQEEAGAGDAVIDLGPDIHSATPYHKPRNHLIGFKLT